MEPNRESQHFFHESIEKLKLRLYATKERMRKVLQDARETLRGEDGKTGKDRRPSLNQYAAWRIGWMKKQGLKSGRDKAAIAHLGLEERVPPSKRHWEVCLKGEQLMTPNSLAAALSLALSHKAMSLKPAQSLIAQYEALYRERAEIIQRIDTCGVKELLHPEETNMSSDGRSREHLQGIPDPTGKFVLLRFIETGGYGDGYAVRVWIQAPEGEIIEASGLGAGLIEAIQDAIEKVFNRQIDKPKYLFRAVREGVDSDAEVVIAMRVGRRVVKGRAQDRDLFGASGKAIVDLLNRLHEIEHGLEAEAQ